jgi:nucleotide-binding universal stress UspA family protein
MYEVVLLSERALADSDARMIADLYGEVDEETHLHLLLPEELAAPLDIEGLADEDRRVVFGVDVAAWVPGAPTIAAAERDPLQRTSSDDETQEALQRSLARLRAHGLDVDGETVPHEPLDALRRIVAERQSNEVVILTRNHALSEMFRTDWAHKARRHLDVPVLHLLEHAED